jgi:branched-chain amino acid transport system substrate-binding protein
VRDLAPVLRAMKNRAPDAFIGLTYPPDTLLASKQSKEIGFNPRFFYTGVGTAYPVYREAMGPGAEGVLGMGSWTRRRAPPQRRISMPM